MKFLEVKLSDGVPRLVSITGIDVDKKRIIKSNGKILETKHSYAEIRAAVKDAAGSLQSIVKVAPKSEVWNDSKS